MSIKVNSASIIPIFMVVLFIFRCIHPNSFYYSTREKVCLFHLLSMNIPKKVCVCSIFNIVLIAFLANIKFGQNSFPLYYFDNNF